MSQYSPKPINKSLPIQRQIASVDENVQNVFMILNNFGMQWSITRKKSSTTLTAEEYISGSNKTLRWHSNDGGKSVDLETLQSKAWKRTGWYIIVGVVAGSGAAGFGTFQQVTAHWAFKENPDGSLGFYETTDGGITWVGPKSTIRK
jgi:hypothetical protein